MEVIRFLAVNFTRNESITAIPMEKFQQSSIDKRPKLVQREGYKGVCKVLYFSAALRRQLGALAWQVLSKFDELENSR